MVYNTLFTTEEYNHPQFNVIFGELSRNEIDIFKCSMYPNTLPT